MGEASKLQKGESKPTLAIFQRTSSASTPFISISKKEQEIIFT